MADFPSLGKPQDARQEFSRADFQAQEPCQRAALITEVESIT